MAEEKTFTKEDMELIMSKEDGLTRYYTKINKILKEYMDMDEEYYSLISLWIIGTYFHKQFSSYPYLFFNAMKGSGKTRILKIISSLSKNGKVVGSMTEAVLFRTASSRTLCIDEIESINAKGQENLRLLLNSAYKKGLDVERMRKNKEGGQEVETFPVYCPIAMANIWGMENVLADRCISVIIEKSSKKEITKLIENFEQDHNFLTARGGLMRLTEKLQNGYKKLQEDIYGGQPATFGLFDNLIQEWNVYQKDVVSIVNKVSNVSIVNKVSKIDNIYDIDNYGVLFSKIDKTDLSGRDLELFFPLFILADMISPEVLEQLIITAKELVKLRKESDREENKDVRLIEFVAQSNYQGYVDVESVSKDFSEFYGEDPKFNTSRSISRALNRLKLILDKRSTGKNRQIKVDVLKAQEKLKLFKEPDAIDKILLEIPEEQQEEAQRIAKFMREGLNEKGNA